MKLLFLIRQTSGGLARHCQDLADSLRAMDVQVEVCEASDWIPDATGKSIDRMTSETLRAKASNSDIVHAFGYRVAWACAEAFGSKEAWVYSAYDLPKTTHPELIDRLERAQFGVASCEAVRRSLRESLLDDVRVVTPGVRDLAATKTRDLMRAELGISESAPLVGAFGRFVAERGFGSLLDSMETLWARQPDSHLLLSGEGPEREAFEAQRSALSRSDQVTLRPWLDSAPDFIEACDLIVVPSKRQGFSMLAAESMRLGQTVLLRRTGGLPELVDERVSGFLFETDSDLGDTAAGLLQSPLTLGVVGNAARVRAEDRFDPTYAAEQVLEGYRELI